MLMTLILAALVAAVVELLVPHTDGGRMAAYVRMIGGLFLLVVLLSPIGEGIALLREVAEGDLAERLPAEFLPDGEAVDYTPILRDTLIAAGEEAVADWVRETLTADFGVPPEDTTIAVLCELTDTTAEAGEGVLILREVRIALSGISILCDPRSIEATVSEALGCPCYVTVG